MSVSFAPRFALNALRVERTCGAIGLLWACLALDREPMWGTAAVGIYPRLAKTFVTNDPLLAIGARVHRIRTNCDRNARRWYCDANPSGIPARSCL